MVCIFTNPSAQTGYDTRSIFKRSLTGLNSVFLLLDWLPYQAVEPSLPYYLPIAGGRIIGLIPFPRVLVLCEMQLSWSKKVDMSLTMNQHIYMETQTWLSRHYKFISAENITRLSFSSDDFFHAFLEVAV